MTDFEKQLIVLKHLDGKKWPEAYPPLMSYDEYVYICEMLKKEFFVEYRIPYDCICRANITDNGSYRLEEMETELRDYLVAKTDLLEDEITIWIRLAERAENLHEGIDNITFNEILMNACQAGFIIPPACLGDNYKLSVLGRKEWNKMIKGFDPSNNPQDNDVADVQNNNMPYVTLSRKKGNKINLIRIVWALWNLGYFVDEDGKKSSIKDVYKVIGHGLNIKLDDNGSSFSQSNRSDTTKPIHNFIDNLKEGEQEFDKFLNEILNALLEENSKNI